MSEPGLQEWRDANARYLHARLAWIRGMLGRHAKAAHGAATESTPSEQVLTRAVEQARCALTAPAALDRLTEVFGLSDFEQDVLLLSAGADLDPSFADACGAAMGKPRAGIASFGLALAVLPGARWGALTPVAPLRYWRFLEVNADDTLTGGVIRIDERILHYLQGISYLDARLRGTIELVSAPAGLPASHAGLARELADLLGGSDRVESAPLVQLSGSQAASTRAIAAAACVLLDVQLHALRTSDLPSSSAERAALSRLWHREALLSDSALLIEHDVDTTDAGTLSFIERMPGVVLVASAEPLPLERATIRLEVSKPGASEQRALWETVLGERAAQLNGDLAALTSQFDLNATEIHAASVQALASSGSEGHDGLRSELWSACRVQTRRHIRELAQHIAPVARWSDLVLPEAQSQTLRDMVSQVRHRATVYEAWGFATKGTRGLGIGALFAGASGTGKTLAAEVIAGELQLDLYRIDLSQVVSKYIGETEKNLRRVFDAAQDSAAVLLFDEADALFGKRSDVKDSHDRYANIEVSYLLQRMEAYRGLAILTTNMKSLIDTAFLRRLRFVVQFPFPDATQRTAIWERVFPASLPVDGVQPGRLAQLNVAGGSIRNIALHASFYAADAGEPVRMSHLLRAAQAECAKLEKGIAPQETRGWT